MNGLYLARNELSQSECAKIDNLCARMVKNRHPEAAAVRFLLFFRNSRSEVEQLLLNVPAVVWADDKYTRYSLARNEIGFALLRDILNIDIVENSWGVRKRAGQFVVDRFPDFSVYDNLDRQKELDISLFDLPKSRHELWTIVKKHALEPRLLSICKQYGASAIPAIQLLANSNSKAAAEALSAACEDHVKREAALTSLAFSHVNSPTDHLADILAELSNGSSGSKAAVCALGIAPHGKWDAALLHAATSGDFDPLAWEFLYRRRDVISDKIRGNIASYCKSFTISDSVDSRLPWIAKFCRWVGLARDDLHADLRSLEKTLPEKCGPQNSYQLQQRSLIEAALESLAIDE